MAEPNWYYFTHYDLGDPSQTDATPCIGASGKDQCYLESIGIRTMALTVDLRKKYGIQFGDKVELSGDAGCAGTYQVEDEMNCRFRGKPCWYKIKNEWKFHPTGNTLRPGTNLYIKGDLHSMPGGACTITKL